MAVPISHYLRYALLVQSLYFRPGISATRQNALSWWNPHRRKPSFWPQLIGYLDALGLEWRTEAAAEGKSGIEG